MKSGGNVEVERFNELNFPSSPPTYTTCSERTGILILQLYTHTRKHQVKI